MQPYPPEQRSIIEDYMLVIIVVSILCGLWIILNEAVVKVADFGIIYAPGTGAEIINFIILLWRILPIALWIGVLAWAIMRAVKREPYAQWG